MKELFHRVEAFNREVIGLPIPTRPTRLSFDRADKGAELIEEEGRELREASQLPDQIDAAIDAMYVACGRLVEMGLTAEQAEAHFLEVHRANMAKVRGTKAERPGHVGYDAIKPEGWTGPNHQRLLSSHFVARLEEEATDAGMVSHTAWPRDPSAPTPITSKPFVSFKDLRKKIILVGHGRHGKDTAAEILRDQYGYKFVSSSLFCAEHVMLPACNIARRGSEQWDFLYPNAQACYDDRHGTSRSLGDHRTFWFNTIKQYCTPDKARLANAIFEHHDIYVGIRDRRELWAAQLRKDVVTVWVDASERHPPEQTSSMNIEPWMADVVLDNNGTLEDLEQNIARLMKEYLA